MALVKLAYNNNNCPHYHFWGHCRHCHPVWCK